MNRLNITINSTGLFFSDRSVPDCKRWDILYCGWFPKISHMLNNRIVIEECLCDSMGVIGAIDIGLKLKKSTESKSAAAIIEALNYQFIISCVERFNGQINKKVSFHELNEFNFRLLHLKAFISRYLREDFSKDSSMEFEYLIADSDYFINSTIMLISEVTIHLTPLLCHICIKCIICKCGYR